MFPPNSRVTVMIDPLWPVLPIWERQTGQPTYLHAQFLDPEAGLSESAPPNYSEQAPVGRVEPYKTYTGGNARELSLPMEFQAQGVGVGGRLSDLDLQEVLIREVQRPAKWLESLSTVFVDRDTNFSYPPPPVYLRIGRLLLMRSVIKEVSINWQEPFDPVSMLPYGVRVEVSFSASTKNISGYDYWTSTGRLLSVERSGVLGDTVKRRVLQ